MTKRLAPVMVLLAGCLWGTLGLFARHLTAAGLGSFELTLVRTGGACLACGLCLLPKPGLFRIRLRDLWCFLGTGVLTAFLPYALFSTGLRYLESSKASILTTSELVTETLIGSILYREKLTPLMLGGIVLILAAVLLLNLSPRRRAVRSAGRTTI